MSLFSSNRVRVIPFDRHFEPQEQDPNLKHLFAEEDAKSAILNWLIAGWRLLQKEGLNSPEAVVEATKEYSHDSNKIALFAEDNLVPMQIVKFVLRKSMLTIKCGVRSTVACRRIAPTLRSPAGHWNCCP